MYDGMKGSLDLWKYINSINFISRFFLQAENRLFEFIFLENNLESPDLTFWYTSGVVSMGFDAHLIMDSGRWGE